MGWIGNRTTSFFFHSFFFLALGTETGPHFFCVNLTHDYLVLLGFLAVFYLNTIVCFFPF